SPLRKNSGSLEAGDRSGDCEKRSRLVRSAAVLSEASATATLRRGERAQRDFVPPSSKERDRGTSVRRESYVPLAGAWDEIRIAETVFVPRVDGFASAGGFTKLDFDSEE